MTLKKRAVLTLVILSQIFPISPASALDPILPISSVTPGALNPSVNQSDIYTTICKTGWTATIRPSSSYTDKIKTQQLFAGVYSFYSDKLLGDYEEDHLISLELGGSPTSVLNLWPEPYAGVTGARLKDVVETKLKTLVCAGKVSLQNAQSAIAQDWYAAYQQYVLGEIPTSTKTTFTPAPTVTPSSTPTQIVASPTPIMTKTIPNLPTPGITTLSSSAFTIQVPEIPGIDFSLMSLSLQLTNRGGIGSCSSEMAISVLPFSVTCSGLPTNSIWVVDLMAKGTYGKTTNTLVFSDIAIASTYPSNLLSPTPTPTPTTSPTSTQTDSPTPAASVTSTTPRTCYVNGYTRKNGTYVNGYYRSC